MTGLLAQRFVNLRHQPVPTHKVGIGKSDPIEVILFILGPPKLFLATAVPVTRPQVKVCLYLHSTVSSPWDCSTCLTVHPLADLFIPTTSQLLREAFGHAAITVRRLFIHI